MEFRRDINGLRAYAVVAVMLFHFGIPGFSGGFIGVDVFFVLSGYLMTAIITQALLSGQFSIRSFYLARARRIIPALAVVVLALLGLGWFWLPPSEYALLGKHASSAMAFASNMTFRDEEGYFDVPSQTKWLLHTWSLSVEWQFYLLYPLILLAIARWMPSRRALGYTIGSLALLSFALAVFLTPTEPETAFYLLPTRAWEMAVGGLVFLAMQRTRRPRPWLEWLGIAGLLASIGLYAPTMAWPGYAAALPILSTACVLLANRSLLTGWMPLQRLGDWSYSIYLWHWPIVVGLGYVGRADHPYWMIGGMAGAILLGAVSYYAIERPARQFLSAQPPRRAGMAALLCILFVGGMGVVIDGKEGISSRVPPEVARIDAERDHVFTYQGPPCGFDRDTKTLVPCDIDAEQGIRWVVWGDSHAQAILGAVRAALPGGIRYYTHQCAMLFHAEIRKKGRDNGCTEYMDQAWQQIRALPGKVTVIVINRYAVNLLGPNESATKASGFLYTDLGPEQATADPFRLYHERLVETLCTLAREREVIAVQPIPEMGIDVPKTMARWAMAGQTDRSVTLPYAAYRQRGAVPLAALQDASRRCGVSLVDPAKVLCQGDTCIGSKDGHPIYVDDDHLSLTGSKLLVPLFAPWK